MLQWRLSAAKIIFFVVVKEGKLRAKGNKLLDLPQWSNNRKRDWTQSSQSDLRMHCHYTLSYFSTFKDRDVIQIQTSPANSFQKEAVANAVLHFFPLLIPTPWCVFSGNSSKTRDKGKGCFDLSHSNPAFSQLPDTIPVNNLSDAEEHPHPYPV